MKRQGKQRVRFRLFDVMDNRNIKIIVEVVEMPLNPERKKREGEPDFCYQQMAHFELLIPATETQEAQLLKRSFEVDGYDGILFCECDAEHGTSEFFNVMLFLSYLAAGENLHFAFKTE